MREIGKYLDSRHYTAVTQVVRRIEARKRIGPDFDKELRTVEEIKQALSGNLCRGREVKTWDDKKEHCFECPFFLELLPGGVPLLTPGS